MAYTITNNTSNNTVPSGPTFLYVTSLGTTGTLAPQTSVTLNETSNFILKLENSDAGYDVWASPGGVFTINQPYSSLVPTYTLTSVQNITRFDNSPLTAFPYFPGQGGSYMVNTTSANNTVFISDGSNTYQVPGNGNAPPKTSSSWITISNNNFNFNPVVFNNWIYNIDNSSGNVTGTVTFTTVINLGGASDSPANPFIPQETTQSRAPTFLGMQMPNTINPIIMIIVILFLIFLIFVIGILNKGK